MIGDWHTNRTKAPARKTSKSGCQLSRSGARVRSPRREWSSRLVDSLRRLLTRERRTLRPSWTQVRGVYQAKLTLVTDRLAAAVGWIGTKRKETDNQV